MEPTVTNEVREGRSFAATNPLLNFILAASLLSKLTHGKSYLQPQPFWYPYRPLVVHPASLIYPFDPYIWSTRLYNHQSGGTPHTPKPALSQQQIIHIHEAASPTAEATDDDASKFTHNYLQEEDTTILAPFEDNLYEAKNDELVAAASDSKPTIFDENNTIPIIINMLKEKLESNDGDQNRTIPVMLTMLMNAMRNESEIGYIPVHLIPRPNSISKLDEINETLNEIPEPLTQYGKNDVDLTSSEPLTTVRNTVAPEYDDVEIVHNEITSQISEKYDEIKEAIKNNESVPFIANMIVGADKKPYMFEAIRQVLENRGIMDILRSATFISETTTPVFDLAVAESQDVLELAGTNNYRRRQKPEYDYYDEVPQRRRPKPSNPPRVQRPQKPVRAQPIRINSKLGQYRPSLQYSDYDDAYDIIPAKVPQRRRPTTRRYPIRKSTPRPVYETEEYNEPQKTNIRRKYYRNGSNRRSTTPSYEEYYENEDFYDISDDGEDYAFARQKVDPRQQTTTRATTTTTEEITTEPSTTSETTATSTEQHTQPPTITPVPSKSPYPYPYPQGAHPGYGPWSGNENISITYPPQAAEAAGPEPANSWYNKYAKSSILRRIQDLLTPSNYYSPVQYDNYSDSVF